MTQWRFAFIPVCCILASLSASHPAGAAEYHGQVTFGGLPLPGATVTVTQGAKKVATVSDQGGLYNFPDLAEGPATLDFEMQCFSTIHTEVTITPSTPAGKWELKLLPLDQILERAKLTKIPPLPVKEATATANPKKPTENSAGAALPDMPRPDIPKPEANEQAADGFLVNGSSNNAATSRFSIDPAFGNQRSGSKGLYNGGLAIVLDNSELDARPYSLSGLDTPKASYNRATVELTFGGPIRIPHLLRHGPNLFVGYQGTRDRNAQIESGLVPTAAERAGDLSSQTAAILDPATGQPFPGNIVPVSAQAAALLQLFPLPNIVGSSLYNYQVPVLNSSHQDGLLARLDKQVSRRDSIYGSFNAQSVRLGSTNLFGFADKNENLGIGTTVNWSHRFNQRLYLNTGYQFSRYRAKVVPYFQNRTDVSGLAGISGNDRNAAYWGPPALRFSSGITPLSDGESSFNRERTDAVSASVSIYHGRHNFTIGGDFRKEQFNDLFQQDPRGTFTFTGAATSPAGGPTISGSDLADFLIGVPDTSSIAYGNADKYLRQPVYDAYATDDWRILTTLTINAGARWEYGAPITELRNRLVNLDLAHGFSAAAPVLASHPIGPLTGSHYPASLIRPDKRGIEPRIGISWRPVPASTIVVRAGYGIYHNTSVYQASALSLAQQAPLSTSLNVENSAACPLTLANGFKPCTSVTADNFAIDPNFRVGYAQTWQLAVQRDLPGAIQLTATYLGVKGTHGVQEFLPNTYPIGAANPCPACPEGFVYQTSGGNSTRQSGLVQMRRRLRNGFTASLLYTYSKSIDNDAYLGGQGHVSGASRGEASPGPATASAPVSATGAVIAQNWLDLRAERGLSSFDQRHLLNLQAQYTSGEGLGGGTLMSGWRGRMLKEWTVVTQVVAGTGLPETPIYLAAVPGTGFTGTIRPDRTGASISSSQPGRRLNPSAYAAPRLGQWGTAGRNSITGPGQFTLDTSFARTFRPSTRFYLDARVDATNLLNHVAFTGWNTVVNNQQFGAPVAAGSMRSLQTTLRLRF